jgi:hypothetical protein
MCHHPIFVQVARSAGTPNTEIIMTENPFEEHLKDQFRIDPKPYHITRRILSLRALGLWETAYLLDPSTIAGTEPMTIYILQKIAYNEFKIMTQTYGSTIEEIEG